MIYTGENVDILKGEIENMLIDLGNMLRQREREEEAQLQLQQQQQIPPPPQQ